MQKYTQSIAELETKPVNVWYPKTSINDVSKISVSPIIGTSTGKEYPSEISSSYKASGSEPLAAPNGLVGYWGFNDNYNDNSGKGNNGIVSGSVPFVTDAKSGKSVSFNNNANNYIRVPDSPEFDLIGKEGFTYSAWIKPTAVPNSYNMFIGHYLPYFNIRSARVLHLSMTAGSVQQHLSTPTSEPLTLNNWYYVAATYETSSGIMKIYINGDTKATSPSFTPPSDYNSDLYIGRWELNANPSDDYPFSGLIDEVAVYNRPLSESEIKSYYESTK